jgi:DNA repair exonuclease SbcCD ATPase subunit
MKVVHLEVQNVKRIRAVSITPGSGPTVIIGGQNAQGKTSVLDAIQMVLGGGKALPEEPIRRGAKQASIVADLGDLVVERVITKTGTTLTVRDKDGNKRSSPQTLLDKLCSKISFDPLEFSKQEPAKQNETLRALVPGLDFTLLDQQRARLYDKRTDVGKDAKRARAHAESIIVPPSTPATAVVIGDLLAQLQTANLAQREVAERAQRITDAQRKLADAERDYATAKAALDKAEQKRMAARLSVNAAEREPEVQAPDTAPIELAIQNAEAINRNVQRRAERDGHEKQAGELEAQVAALTAQIDAIDQQKHDALAAAAFPVPGLGMAADGPTLNGVPLAQASGAEKLKVSVGIGLALNPEVKVLLVRDASLLDDASLAIVADMVAAAGAQIWLERVGSGDPSAVIISDGQVDESATSANSAERAAS